MIISIGIMIAVCLIKVAELESDRKRIKLFKISPDYKKFAEENYRIEANNKRIRNAQEEYFELVERIVDLIDENQSKYAQLGIIFTDKNYLEELLEKLEDLKLSKEEIKNNLVVPTNQWREGSHGH